MIFLLKTKPKDPTRKALQDILNVRMSLKHSLNLCVYNQNDRFESLFCGVDINNSILRSKCCRCIIYSEDK